MSKVKLTIGIPTWNRSSEIRDAIDSILAQLDDALRPQVEILISDNASTDATQSVIRSCSERDPALFSFHRNPENIGFSRNVDALFRHARGEFVLLLDIAGGDGHFVEKAKAHRPVFERVMAGRPHGAKRISDLSLDHRVHGNEQTSRRQERHVIRGG